jgi:hypothetical protein
MSRHLRVPLGSTASFEYQNETRGNHKTATSPTAARTKYVELHLRATHVRPGRTFGALESRPDHRRNPIGKPDSAA